MDTKPTARKALVIEKLNPLLSIQQALLILGVGKSTFHKKIKPKLPKPVFVGARPKWFRDDLTEFGTTNERPDPERGASKKNAAKVAA